MSADTGAVSGAVEDYLEGRDFTGQAGVLAEVARALARQLDEACSSDSARGLSASPPLARRLVEVVSELASTEEESAMRAEQRERRRYEANWAQRQPPARNGGAA